MKKIIIILLALVGTMCLDAQAMMGKTVGIKGTAKRTGNIKVSWVQLWAGGPKFAEYNVGAANNKAEDYGGYYCWGSGIDQDSKRRYKDGTEPLTGTDDTATNLWGSSWRMPSFDELRSLLYYCDVEWTTVKNVNGCRFTGKGDYASNSLFLPAAGQYDFGEVVLQNFFSHYWSSTPRGSGGACGLQFYEEGGQNMFSDVRDYGYSIRAVLVE